MKTVRRMDPSLNLLSVGLENVSLIHFSIVLRNFRSFFSLGRIVRSGGCMLRKNLNDMVTPEAVRDNWTAVTDMSNAKAFDSIQVRSY